MSADSLAAAIRAVIADAMNNKRPIPAWAEGDLREALAEHERSDSEGQR